MQIRNTNERSIPGQVLSTAAQIPDQNSIVDEGVPLTYRDLADLITAGGRAMLAAGIGRGDRVALWAPNSARWIVAALAGQSVGAVIVPINTRYKTTEAVYPLVKTTAKLLIADHGFMDIDSHQTAEQAAVTAGHPIQMIDLAPNASGPGSWDAFLAAGDAIDPARWEAAHAEVGHEDLSDVMFTSGSTGRPKGVRHRHGPTLRQTFNTIEENGIRCGDRLLIVNPFFHVFGYTGGWVPGLFAGGTVYPLPVFDVTQVLNLIESEEITYFPGPPTIFHSILADPHLDDVDVSSLRASLTGAADVPVGLIQAMLERLTFERVIQAYGMTECGTATNTIASDSPHTVATTVGKASEDLEVAVVDEHNNQVSDGDAGEIVVRGYAVMDGYFDDPDATAATIDAAGWLHTGDRGACDEDGYFRILGRIKDMLIVGGFNVYPAEVEDTIREHPNVEDVALIGVPDARLGEVGCAFIMQRRPIDFTEFVAWCRERMANFKVPRYLEPLEALPLTGSNKVSKVDLREIAAVKGIGESV